MADHSKSASAFNNTADADLQAEFANRDRALRIKYAAEKKSYNQKRLSDASGVPAGRISEYWNGKREPGAVNLFAIADALDVSAEWLALGSGGNGSLDRLVSVVEIDLAYGLGGTYADGPVEVQTLQFPRSWVETITATAPDMLIMARGRGDSMQPTIQDGDMVMIDRSQRSIREQDAIWALTIGDFAMIKRVRAGGERIRILSDNPSVPPDDVHHEEINVVGRVIFIGRRL